MKHHVLRIGLLRTYTSYSTHHRKNIFVWKGESTDARLQPLNSSRTDVKVTEVTEVGASSLVTGKV